MEADKSANQKSAFEFIEDATAEFAFRKLFGLPTEADAAGRFVGSGEYFDAVVNGYTVRIVRTPDPNGHLIVPREEADWKHADYYALMVGTDREWRYAGVIAAKDLFTPEHLGPIKVDQRRLDLTAFDS